MVQSRLKPELRPGLAVGGDAGGIVVGRAGDQARPQLIEHRDARTAWQRGLFWVSRRSWAGPMEDVGAERQDFRNGPGVKVYYQRLGSWRRFACESDAVALWLCFLPRRGAAAGGRPPAPPGVCLRQDMVQWLECAGRQHLDRDRPGGQEIPALAHRRLPRPAIPDRLAVQVLQRQRPVLPRPQRSRWMPRCPAITGRPSAAGSRKSRTIPPRWRMPTKWPKAPASPSRYAWRNRRDPVIFERSTASSPQRRSPWRGRCR